MATNMGRNASRYTKTVKVVLRWLQTTALKFVIYSSTELKSSLVKTRFLWSWKPLQGRVLRITHSSNSLKWYRVFFPAESKDVEVGHLRQYHLTWRVYIRAVAESDYSRSTMTNHLSYFGLYVICDFSNPMGIYQKQNLHMNEREMNERDGKRAGLNYSTLCSLSIWCNAVLIPCL